MAEILQTISNAFSEQKIFVFWFISHWSLFGLVARRREAITWTNVAQDLFATCEVIGLQGVEFNTLRPRQHGHHFADDTFKRIFLNENVIISIKISLKFVPKGPINNIPALVQIMAWRRPGDKPLSEPMMVLSLTHICVTRPQCDNDWINFLRIVFGNINVTVTWNSNCCWRTVAVFNSSTIFFIALQLWCNWYHCTELKSKRNIFNQTHRVSGPTFEQHEKNTSIIYRKPLVYSSYIHIY